MATRINVVVAVYAAVLGTLGWAAEPEAATRGRDFYEKRCTGCHSLDNNKVGPALRNVYGRRAAADPNFPYSDALKQSRQVWDEATMDKWLADPDSLVPENDMSFRLGSAAERSAIIAFLKQIAGKQGQHQ